jgi:hypothetical protein
VRRAHRFIASALLVGAAFALAASAVTQDFRWDTANPQGSAASAVSTDVVSASTGGTDDFHWD